MDLAGRMMSGICTKCQRHSISPDAKKQCRYLCEIAINGESIHVEGESGDNCRKFKAKVKRKKKIAENELLF